ncbi:Maf-like protein [Candidatus Omnitrophus magneticus]|uniref:Nucleoside triphosphate pyrophosphatase n=1 Tax=Candidatus Omnitrophus magneticus TaxID=1609969 RepID=A0A0F0CRJ3_9BACT|nr:Maf-like protein [Candidatus Omnitrophus magneticus]
MTKINKKIILASASKRRAEILLSCGIVHTIIPSGMDEIMDQTIPIKKIVLHNAKIKAEAVTKKVKNAVVISADTLVTHDGEIIGKPKDERDAKRLLKKFSGENIEVFTAIYIVDVTTSKKSYGVTKSDVRVAKINDKNINKIFPLLGPYDKAGGFSIEGAGSILFDDIRGSYFNILGLSMMALRRLFEKIGLDIIDFVTIPLQDKNS